MKAASDPPSLQDFSREISRSALAVKPQRITGALSFLDERNTLYTLSSLDVPETIAPDTLKELSTLTLKNNCTLYQTQDDKKGRTNRMGETLGHFECGPALTWLQGDMLAKGLARVRTTPENFELARPMLQQENTAREKKWGLWAQPENAVLTPNTAGQHLNSFQLVSGTVFAVAQTHDMTYLNFDRDWHADFTIGIPDKLRRDFAMAHINIQSLKGEVVRVRGWLREYNGPYMELDHIQQLELLGTDQPSTNSPVVETPSTGGMHTIGAPTPPTVKKPQAPNVAQHASGEKPDIIDNFLTNQ